MFSWRYCCYFDNKQTNQSARIVCVCVCACKNQYVDHLCCQCATTTTYTHSHTTSKRTNKRANKRTHEPIHIICNMLNGIYKETNACYIYDLFILCCNFRARQPNYAKRTCFSVAYIEIYIFTKFILARRCERVVFILVDPSALFDWIKQLEMWRVNKRARKHQTNVKTANQQTNEPIDQPTSQPNKTDWAYI